MSGKKGLELPINMIVVIAIAVLVLVVVAAFFAGRLGGGSDEIALNSAFNNGCNTLRFAHSCDVNSMSTIRVRGYAPPGQAVTSDGWPFSGGTDSICQRKGYFNDADCARVCGCAIP